MAGSECSKQPDGFHRCRFEYCDSQVAEDHINIKVLMMICPQDDAGLGLLQPIVNPRLPGRGMFGCLSRDRGGEQGSDGDDHDGFGDDHHVDYGDDDVLNYRFTTSAMESGV